MSINKSIFLVVRHGPCISGPHHAPLEIASVRGRNLVTPSSPSTCHPGDHTGGETPHSLVGTRRAPSGCSAAEGGHMSHTSRRNVQGVQEGGIPEGVVGGRGRAFADPAVAGWHDGVVAGLVAAVGIMVPHGGVGDCSWSFVVVRCHSDGHSVGAEPIVPDCTGVVELAAEGAPVD